MQSISLLFRSSWYRLVVETPAPTVSLAMRSTSDLQMQTEKVDPLLSRNSTVVDILIAAEQTQRTQCLSKEDNNRGRTNGGVLPDEGQRARFPVNSVTRDSIRSLVTRVE